MPVGSKLALDTTLEGRAHPVHRKQPERGSPHLCVLTKEGHIHIGQCHNFPEAQMSETRASKEEGVIHCSVHSAHLQTTTWQALPHFIKVKYNIQTAQQY